MILRIYEIQNIGKGVITEILPQNLLLTKIELIRIYPSNKVVTMEKNLAANARNFLHIDFGLDYSYGTQLTVVVFETVDTENKIQVPIKLGQHNGFWYYSVDKNVLNAEVHALVGAVTDSYQE